MQRLLNRDIKDQQEVLKKLTNFACDGIYCWSIIKTKIKLTINKLDSH